MDSDYHYSSVVFSRSAIEQIKKIPYALQVLPEIIKWLYCLYPTTLVNIFQKI